MDFRLFLNRNHGFDYMNFRCWIGLWTAFILIVMVVTDASYLVKYITRFTGKTRKVSAVGFFLNFKRKNRFLEESFAALIGIIFIYEAFDKMIEINHHRPVRLHANRVLPANCSCSTVNGTSFGSPTETISVNQREKPK